MTNAHPTAHFTDFTKPKAAKSLELIYNDPQMRLTYKARGAIYRALLSTKGRGTKTVLAPSFHCPTVIHPILDAGLGVQYYRIKADLSIDNQDLINQLSANIAAVIIINYYGFEQEIDAIQAACNTLNIPIIDDWSHSFLKTAPLELTGKRVDFSVYSFWKIAPCHEGGGIRQDGSNNPIIEKNHITLSTRTKSKNVKQIIESAVNNMSDGIIKHGIQRLEQIRVNRNKSQQTQRMATDSPTISAYAADMEHYADEIPAFSSYILKRCNLAHIIGTRRKNYVTLANHINHHPVAKSVFPTLPARCCPWAYPVLIDNRSDYDHLIKKAGAILFTFGEELHQSIDKCSSTETIEIARYLSKSLLSLSIHQDIDQQQINKTAAAIRTVLG